MTQAGGNDGKSGPPNRSRIRARAGLLVRRRAASGRRERDTREAPERGPRDIVSGIEAGYVPLPLSRRGARELSLVLTARGLEHELRRGLSGWRILTNSDDAERALRELNAYQRENVHRQRHPPPATVANVGRTVLAISLLLAFYGLVENPWPSLGLYPEIWDRLGSADASRILAGEYWRLVTALTLHADPAHVLGNVVIGSPFAVLVTRRLGLGAGLLLILASGVAGNLVNALALGARHNSIGFSTAVFGAAGIMAGLHGMHPPPGAGRPWTQAVVAGLGLLALLGVGGERTDVTAHLFGFGAGLVLGMGAGWFTRRGGRISPKFDRICGAATVLIPAGAWILAFASR